eukprot:2170016-Pyramimonas_sp.AAC.1
MCIRDSLTLILFVASPFCPLTPFPLPRRRRGTKGSKEAEAQEAKERLARGLAGDLAKPPDTSRPLRWGPSR